MSSNMLFKISKLAPIFSNPLGKVTGYVNAGTYIRVTHIYLAASNILSFEIGENEKPDDELGINEIKYLYVEPGDYYIQKEYATFVQNFVGDMNNSEVTNRVGTVKCPVAKIPGFYGPNLNSPVKFYLLNGERVKIIRSMNGWYMLGDISEHMCWVEGRHIIMDPVSSANDNSIGSSSYGYLQSVDYDHLQKPVSFPGRTIKGSGSENMLYDNKIRSLVQSAGIYNREEIEWYDKFSRFGYLDPYNTLTNSREYVFITKPDLHIFASQNSDVGLNPELGRMAIFQDAYYRYKPVLRQLQWSVDRKNPFMNLLSNSIKSSLDLPGISADEIETSANIYGTKMTYRKASESSDESFDFSIEFEDTKYLEVYMLFKLYDEYEKRKLWGNITPPDINYIYRKILHDQVSIYKFIVADDGMSLIYWAKLTGCYPKSVPREAFSDIADGANGSLRFSIQWHAQFVEDMDPQILSDFNTLIMPKYNTTTELPIYNSEIDAVDGRWAATPYIKQRNIISDGADFRYLLGWRI